MRLWLFAALTIACGAPGGRFLLLEREEVSGQSRLCVYQDAVGAEAITVGAGEMCPPYLDLEE